MSAKSDSTLLRLLKGEISMSYCDKQVDWSSSSSPMSIDSYTPKSYGTYNCHSQSRNYYTTSISRVTPNVGGRLN
jgi:hypothetical protein